MQSSNFICLYFTKNNLSFTTANCKLTFTSWCRYTIGFLTIESNTREFFSITSVIVCYVFRIFVLKFDY